MTATTGQDLVAMPNGAATTKTSHSQNVESRAQPTAGEPGSESSNRDVHSPAAVQRTSYLPLLSPCIRDESSSSTTQEDQRPTYFTQRPSMSAADDKGKSKRALEESPPVSPTNTSKALPIVSSPTSADKVEPAAKRARLPVVTLPSEVAQSLLSVLESSDFDFEHAAGRQYRAMSVPRNLNSQVDASSRAALISPRIGGSASVAVQPGVGERRESVRAQQLALLASQARLASAGASSIGTALRAEKAMKGAVWKAVEGVQAARQARNSVIAGTIEGRSKDGADGEGENSATTSATASPSKAAVDRDPANAWSEVLSSPSAACSFLDSAKEVAHGWANGFYAYEKEWVDGALSREKSRLDHARRAASEADGIPIAPSSPPKSPTYIARRPTEEDRHRRKSHSEPPVTLEKKEKEISEEIVTEAADALSERRQSTAIVPLPDSATVTAAKRSLLAAQRRLSTALPLSDRLELSGRSKLVDVLSNFATLIDSRKEGCHSLELLAHNARRLSSVQLPNVRSEGSTHHGASLLSSPAARRTSMHHEMSHIDTNSTNSADSPRGAVVDPIG